MLLSFCSPLCENTTGSFSLQPGRGSLPEPDPTGTLILDFSASRCVVNKFPLVKPPDLWHAVIAAWWYNKIDGVLERIFLSQYFKKNQNEFRRSYLSCLIRALISSSELYPHDLVPPPKAPSANAISLGISVSTYEFEETQKFIP